MAKVKAKATGKLSGAANFGKAKAKVVKKVAAKFGKATGLVPQIRSPFRVPEDLRYETTMMREPRIKRDHAQVFFRPHPKRPDVERTKRTLGSENAKTVFELGI